MNEWYNFFNELPPVGSRLNKAAYSTISTFRISHDVYESDIFSIYMQKNLVLVFLTVLPKLLLYITHSTNDIGTGTEEKYRGVRLKENSDGGGGRRPSPKTILSIMTFG